MILEKELEPGLVIHSVSASKSLALATNAGIQSKSF